MIDGRDRPSAPAHMLVVALTHELQLIDGLRHALRHQRESLADADADGIDLGARAVARMRLTLAEAQRGRATLMSLLTGTPTTSLDALDTYLDGPLPEAVAEARDAIRRATSSLTHDLTLTQRIMDHSRNVDAALL